MDAPSPGGLGGTYAGAPLAVAASHAVLDIIEDEQLCARANKLGGILKDRLQSLRPRVPHIADIRGLGAMVAVEFARPGARGEPIRPDADFTRKVQAHALEHGLLLLTCGVYSNVIRFLFPLTIQQAVLDEGLDILEEAILA